VRQADFEEVALWALPPALGEAYVKAAVALQHKCLFYEFNDVRAASSKALPEGF